MIQNPNIAEEINEPGRLVSIGRRKLGIDSYEYYKCQTCGTEFPVLRGEISCNGKSIKDCPWCAK